MRQTHIKSKALAIVLSFLMALTMMPCWAIMTADEVSAETGNVAKIDDTEYATLAKAIAAVPDSAETPTTVELLADTKEKITIPATKNVILDLGEHTLTNASEYAYYPAIKLQGKLRIEATTGGINGAAGSAIELGNTTSDLIIDNGNYMVGGTGSTIEMGDRGRLTINNGTFTGSKTKPSMGMIVNASSSGPYNITINDGTFSTVSSLNSTDSNRTSLIHLEPHSNSDPNKRSNLIINGGTFTVNHDSSSRPEITYCCVGVHNNSAYVEINGGTFTNAIAKETLTTDYLKQLSPALEVYSKATATIKGGTFTSNGWAAQLYAKEATIGVSNATFTSVDNNSYGLVLSSYTDGVYNISNCTCNGSIALFGTGDSKGTADINITGGSYNGTTYGMYFGENSDVTIDNATVTAGSSNYAVRNYKGDLTINGGTFTGACGLRDENKTTINGGTFTGSSYGLQVYTGGKMTINNAEVTGTDYGIYNYDGQLTVKGGSFTGNRALYDMNDSTIENGTFNGKDDGNAVYSTGYATTNISGGTFSTEGKNTIYVTYQNKKDSTELYRRGVLNISGNPKINGGSSSTQSVGVFNYGGTVNVSNGLFKSNQDATSNFTTYNNSDGGGSFTVSGGVYNIKPTKSTSVTLGEGLSVINNTDPDTKDNYPYTVGVANYVAKIGDNQYETLAAAAQAAKSGETIELLKDIENTGAVTLPTGVTLDGANYKISGNSNISLAVAGGQTVKDVEFKNIHNGKNRLSPIYGYGLEGTATITNCQFNGWDWDAIQITPVEGAEITITNNTFTANTGELKSNRAVHIQSEQNVDFSAKVTGNKFLNVANLKNTGLEIYYPAKASKLDCSGNYIDAPMGVCIGVGESYNNAYTKAFPLKNQELSADVAIQAIINKNENIFLYPTFKEALEAVQNGETIELVTDITDAVGISIGTGGMVEPPADNFTVDFAGHKYVVNKPGAGSSGTKTQAFQLLKGQTITFKNGTIECDPDNRNPATDGAKNIKRIFQSYANLTLDDMKIDGTYVFEDNAVAEFANGNVNIVGNTSIIAKASANAFNVDTWGAYPEGARVTVDTTGEIGSINCYSEEKVESYTPSSLTVTKGKIKEVKDSNPGDVIITLNGGVYTVEPNVGIPAGKAVINNPDEETKAAYPYTIGDPAETHYVIKTTSKMVNSGGTESDTGHIALLEGGGQYAKGASVTLKASPVDNFEFLGWFKGTNTVPETTNMVLEFAASENADYVAKYKAPAANATVKAEVVSKKTSPEALGAGGEVAITGSPGDTAEVAVGTEVTLTATPTGDHSFFIAWQNPNGAILSTENTFTTTVLQSKTVQAVFANEGAALVNYKDEANQSLSSKLYFASEALEAAEAVAPSKKGQKFSQWVDSKGMRMEETDVKKAIQQSAKATSVGVVTLIAQYEDVNEYTIKVYSILEDGTALGDPKTFTNNLGTPSEITAAEDSDSGNYHFQGFKTSADGQIVSTARQFTVNPERDIELWVVYSTDTAATATPAITLDSPFDASTNVHKIGYTMSWNLPEGYTLVEAGFCYGTSETEIKGDNPRKSVSELTGRTGSFTMNMYAEGHETNNIYVYAYIIYKQGENDPQTLRIGTAGTAKTSDSKYLTTKFSDVKEQLQQ